MYKNIFYLFFHTNRHQNSIQPPPQLYYTSRQGRYIFQINFPIDNFMPVFGNIVECWGKSEAEGSRWAVVWAMHSPLHSHRMKIQVQGGIRSHPSLLYVFPRCNIYERTIYYFPLNPNLWRVDCTNVFNAPLMRIILKFF